MPAKRSQRHPDRESTPPGIRIYPNPRLPPPPPLELLLEDLLLKLELLLQLLDRKPPLLNPPPPPPEEEVSRISLRTRMVEVPAFQDIFVALPAP